LKILCLIFAIAASHAESLNFYENENVTICEKPSSIRHLTHIQGSPYFLNYGDSWPKNYLTVLIWERDITNLEINPNTYFYSNDVCINGNISFYNRSPQVRLENFHQIIPVHEFSENSDITNLIK
jgi:hypothetical protein